MYSKNLYLLLSFFLIFNFAYSQKEIKKEEIVEENNQHNEKYFEEEVQEETKNAMIKESIATYKENNSMYEKNKIIFKIDKNSMVNVQDNFNLENRLTIGIPLIDNILSQSAIKGIIQMHPMFPATPNTEIRRGLARVFMIEYYDCENIFVIMNQLNQLNEIEYAEPSFIYSFNATPNDPDYDDQEFLEQIKADSAWNTHKGEDGDSTIVVGICDSGVEWHHPDLVDNIWQNLGEDADGDGKVIEYVDGEWQFDPDDLDGVDDDGNGKTDDLIGWNWVTGDDTENYDPDGSTNNTHGTHVAGLAAGVTNNEEGIASVSWNVKYLPTKHSYNNTYSSRSLYNTYSGLTYLADMGVDVINCSWGGSSYSSYSQNTIDYVIDEGVVIIAAAGNSNTDALHYPSAYEGVLSVASLDSDDGKASYSNYGISIDVSSPGSSLYSTVPGHDYGNMSGTSMASPVAAGAFALLKSYRPTWDNDDLIEQFLGSADDVDSDNEGYENLLGYGRVNVKEALETDDAEISKALKLLLEEYTFEDEDEDGSFEPGEIVDFGFTIRNFNPLYGSNSLEYEVTCASDDITIYNSSASVLINEDDNKEVNIVYFAIDEDADTQIFTINLEFTNDDGIIIGDSYSFDLVIYNDAPVKVYAYNTYDPGSDIDEGPISFYINQPQDISQIADQSDMDDIYSGTWYNGEWYGITSGDILVKIDSSDGTRTTLGTCETGITGLAYNPDDGLIYAVSTDDLYTINPSSGDLTLVGENSGTVFINLACDSAGNLYSVDIDSDAFGQFDLETGEFTELFDLGVDLNYAQDMEFDLNTGKLYISAYPRNDDSFIGLIDIDNEQMGILGKLKNGMEVTSLVFPHDIIAFSQLEPYDDSNKQDLDVTFKWRNHEDADSYDLIVSENSDLSAPVIDINTSNTQYSPPTDLDYETRYYWKVKAKDGGTVIDESLIWDFVTMFDCYEEPTDDDGDGYYDISSLCHLRWIMENPDSWSWDFELLNNIDASDTENWYPDDHDNDGATPDSAMGWKPIGNFVFNEPESGYYGEFDGNGYYVSNIYMNRPTEDYLGFFGSITDSGYVHELEIKNVNFTGNAYLGVLAGRNYAYSYGSEINIENCYTSGNLYSESYIGGFFGALRLWNGDIFINESGSSANIYIKGNNQNYVGGLTGYIYGSGDTLNIEDFYFNGKIEALDGFVDNVGGIIGYAGLSTSSLRISACRNSGEIIADDRTGGLIGYLTASNDVYTNIINSYSIGDISSNLSTMDYVGGLIGYISNSGNLIKIEKSFNTGNIESRAYAGGLIGNCSSTTANNIQIYNSYNRGDIDISNYYAGGTIGLLSYSTVENCYSTGKITGDSFIGGICGDNISGTISNCFWDKETAEIDSSDGGTGKTTTQMKTESTFTDAGWDFTDVWDISSSVNNGYPYIQSNDPSDILFAPDLASPDDNSNGKDISLDLKWHPVSAADEYQVQLSKYRTFSTLVVDDNLTDTTKSVSGLDYDQTYYWRVKSINDTEESGWSETWMFSTIFDPDACVLVNESFEDAEIPDDWSIVKIENNVDWVYNVSGGYSGNPDAAYDGDYNARLYASSIGNITRLITSELDYDECSGDLELTFYEARDKWAGDLDSLYIYYSIVGDTTWVLLDKYTEEETDWVKREIDLSEIYDDFQIAFEGYANYGYGVCLDQIRIFGVDSGLSAPTLSSPSNGATEQETSLTLEWNSVTDATSYDVQLSDDNTFATTIVDDNVSDTDKYVTGLDNSETYYWRARAKNSSETSGWSSVWSFTTKDDSGIPDTLEHFDYTSTNKQMTIRVLTTAELKIGDYELQDGDEIAVFTQDDVCAGALKWKGENTTFNAYGKTTTPPVDGLEENEVMVYKVWKRSENTEYEVSFVSHSDYLGNWINGKFDTSVPFKQLDTLRATTDITQSISISSGWNIISSYVEPSEPDVQDVMTDIGDTLVIMRNSFGKVYIPDDDFPINTIGDWNNHHGYSVYLTGSSTLDIVGMQITPESETITLNTGWSTIGYLRDNAMNVEDALEDIESNLIIARDGGSGIYIPDDDFPINTIGNMMPGKGYQMYVDASVDLTYPSNSAGKVSADAYDNQITATPVKLRSDKTTTGNSAVLIMEDINIADGTEIGAYNSEGQLYGSGIFMKGKTAVVLNGDNEMTEASDGFKSDEIISFRLLDNENQSRAVELVSISEITGKSKTDNLRYKTGGIYTAKLGKQSETTISGEGIEIIPSPVRNSAKLIIHGLTDKIELIKIYNISGQELFTIKPEIKSEETTEYMLNTQNLESGFYLIKVITNGKTLHKEFIKIK